MHKDCLVFEVTAMQVLSDAGPAGLNVVEIAKRIQRQGLRDLRTAKSPEVIRLSCHCSSGGPHARCRCKPLLHLPMQMPAFAVLLQLMCSGRSPCAGVCGSCALAGRCVWQACPSNLLPGVLPEGCKHVRTPLVKPDAIGNRLELFLVCRDLFLVDRHLLPKDRSLTCMPTAGKMERVRRVHPGGWRTANLPPQLLAQLAQQRLRQELLRMQLLMH